MLPCVHIEGHPPSCLLVFPLSKLSAVGSILSKAKYNKLKKILHLAFERHPNAPILVARTLQCQVLPSEDLN